MRRLLSLVLRLGLAAACLLYALWDLDLRRIGDLIASLRPWALITALVLGVGIYAIQGLRFHVMTGRRIGLLPATLATLFGQGLNYLLPARLGELGKALYLRRHAGLPMRASLGLIFWERFADLNLLLFLAIGASLLAHKALAWMPLAVLVGGLWCCVGLVLLLPGPVERLLRHVPLPRPREFLLGLLRHFTAASTPAFFLWLALLSALTWGSLAAVFAFNVLGVAGLAADGAAITAAFVASSLSFAVPSSPGGLGLFEAAMVFAFGRFGLDRESALVVALLIRLTQGLPAVLAAALLLDKESLSLASFRKLVTASPDEGRTGDADN